MTVTGLIDFNEISWEIVNFIRNQDIFTTSTRGVTTTTETFSGDASETHFTVSNTPLANIRSVQVNSVLQTYGKDYKLNTSNQIIFTSAPASGSDNISVQYDYGDDQKILPEWDQSLVTVSKYPLIGVHLTSGRSVDASSDGNVNISDFLVSFYVYAKKKDGLNNYARDLRKAILNNKKNFYNLRYVTPISYGPIVPQDNNKVYLRTVECSAPLNEEVIS